MTTLYSHSNKKNLKDHLSKVGNMCKDKVLTMELNLTIIDREELAKLSYLVGIAHDFGKSTTYFQKHLFSDYFTLTHHGLISSLFGYVLIKSYFSENDGLFPLLAYIIIRKHHGNLESFEERVENLIGDVKKQYEDIEENTLNQLLIIYNDLLKSYKSLNFKDLFGKLRDIIKKAEDGFAIFLLQDFFCNNYEDDEEKAIELFLITNLLYSLLIDNDKKDAAGILEINRDRKKKIASIKDYLDYCRKNNTEKFSENIEINKLRNQFSDDVLNNPDIDSEQYLYTLTAPTGIGKTFTAYSFANKIRNLNCNRNRMIYCLPFTAIIDQNHKELENILKYNFPESYQENPIKYLFKHHYLAPPVIQKNQNMQNDSLDSKCFDNYFDNKLLVESWESENIVTTFVQLLESIIGNRNSYLRKFHNIINSVLILDEVQNIPVEYFDLTGKVLTVLAERFKTYVLLMTATQPMLIKEGRGVKLVNVEKYALDPIFNRVNLEVIDDLESKTYADFIECFKSDFKAKNTLIVCNTIGTAQTLYDNIIELSGKEKKFAEYEVFSLTTYLTPIDRMEKIDIIKEKIRNNCKIIVVSTQLIEAGVDVSFELVYRDMGPLDSIIQVAGRSNRHRELSQKGILKLVNINDDNNIYSPKLISISEEIVLKEKKYESKDFLRLSRSYYKRIKEEARQESRYLLNAIKYLNYSLCKKDQIPVKEFKLINNSYGKVDIIICHDANVERKIHELDNLYDELNSDWDDGDREELWAKMVIIKKELSQYRISVYSNQLNVYRKHNIIQDSRYLPYVSHEDQNDYLYSKDKGFLREPKKEFPSSVFA